ncbi:MAG: hypothetical protein JWQ99_3858, partial [Blastococcus sp.]|nr:hypothetical protein [Blastococcus sp.]
EGHGGAGSSPARTTVESRRPGPDWTGTVTARAGLPARRTGTGASVSGWSAPGDQSGSTRQAGVGDLAMRRANRSPRSPHRGLGLTAPAGGFSAGCDTQPVVNGVRRMPRTVVADAARRRHPTGGSEKDRAESPRSTDRLTFTWSNIRFPPGQFLRSFLVPMAPVEPPLSGDPVRVPAPTPAPSGACRDDVEVRCRLLTTRSPAVGCLADECRDRPADDATQRRSRRSPAQIHLRWHGRRRGPAAAVGGASAR